MIANDLMVENTGELFGSHATTRILHAEFDIIGLFGRRDDDFPTPGSELAGIIRQRVNHEEGQHSVGLDDSLCGVHCQ